VIPKSETELKSVAAQQALAWSKKPIEALREELSEPVGYERDGDSGWLQFEVTLLENEADYVQVSVIVGDGSMRWAKVPVSTGFLAYSGGRVDI